MQKTGGILSNGQTATQHRPENYFEYRLISSDFEPLAQCGWRGGPFTQHGQHHAAVEKTRRTCVERAQGSAGVRSPESGIRSPESGIRNPDSGIRNPESGIRNPESGIRNPESGILDSGFESGILDSILDWTSACQLSGS